jgi:plastocyanin
MHKKLFALSLLCIFAWACKPPGIEEGPNTPAPTLTATLKGRIIFEGTAPTPKKISTSSDPACKNSNLVSEEVVVSDGGLENVILYVSGGDIEGKSFPVSREEPVLSQEGCHYSPHALTLQVGQRLKIVNNDETAHNIHAWSEINPAFNESQSSKGVVTTKTFLKEEVMIPVRCDVHNWMNAFIGVFNTPLSAVSGKAGAYELKLPVGAYTITAVHEKFGKKEQMVTVAENSSAELNFTFKAEDKSAD